MYIISHDNYSHIGKTLRQEESFIKLHVVT